MKNIIAIISLMIFTQGAFAYQVIDGQFDAEKDEVILTISHSGGCGDHSFFLEYGEINYQDYQRKVSANLLHFSEDNCEARLVEEYRLNIGRAVRRPSDLTIFGKDGSSVTVRVE